MDPAFELLLEKLKERRMQLRDAICDGSSADFAAYKHLVGMLEGIEWSLVTMKDIEALYVEQ